MNENSLFGPGVGTVWKRKKKSRTSLKSLKKLPDDLAKKLGEAELHFINGDNQKAIELLSDVSLKAPKLPEPYSIMALIYESSGDSLRALQLYALAATYTSKASHIWSKVLELALGIGEYDQALTAISRCIKFQPTAELSAERIRIYVRQKSIRRAKQYLRSFLWKYPNQEYFLIEFGDLVAQVGYHDLAIESYLRFIFYLFGTANVRMDLFPYLVMKQGMQAKNQQLVIQQIGNLFYAMHKAMDAFLDKEDGLYAAMELVDIYSEWTLSMRSSLTPNQYDVIPELPMPIVIMYAICKLRTGDESESNAALQMLKPVIHFIDQGELLPHLLVDNNEDNNENYSIIGTEGDIDDTLDTMRQLMRTAIELVAVGMLTRAGKLLNFVDKTLTKLCCYKEVRELNEWKAGWHYNSNIADGNNINSFLSLENKRSLKTMIPKIWCQLGSTYESMHKPEQALGAYKAALQVDSNHVQSLREYARIARSLFPLEIATAAAQLGRHFMLLIEEFETLRVQGVLPNNNNNNSTTNSGVDRNKSMNRSIDNQVKGGGEGGSCSETLMDAADDCDDGAHNSNNDSCSAIDNMRLIADAATSNSNSNISSIAATTADVDAAGNMMSSTVLSSSLPTGYQPQFQHYQHEAASVPIDDDEEEEEGKIGDKISQRYDDEDEEDDDEGGGGEEDEFDLGNSEDDEEDEEEGLGLTAATVGHEHSDELISGMLSGNGYYRNSKLRTNMDSNNNTTAIQTGGDNNSNNDYDDNDIEDRAIEDDGEEEQDLYELQHWRVACQSYQFSETELRYEILALVEWADLFKGNGQCNHSDNHSEVTTFAVATTTTTTTADMPSYCSILLPILLKWCSDKDSSNNNNSSNSNKNGMITDLSRIHRNKEGHTISMYQFANSTASNQYSHRHWLDVAQNMCSRLVTALVVSVNIEQLFTNDYLLTMAQTVSAAMEAIGSTTIHQSNAINNTDSSAEGKKVTTEEEKEGALLKEESKQLLLLCQKKSIEKLHYSNGRNRFSKVNYVVYDNNWEQESGDYKGSNFKKNNNNNSNSSSSSSSDVVGLDSEQKLLQQAKSTAAIARAAAAAVAAAEKPKRRRSTLRDAILAATAAGGGNGLGGSSHVIAWNRFRRPTALEEDILVITARKISETAGTAAAALLYEPGSVHYANMMYSEVLRNLDPFLPNSSVENQLPLNRLQIISQQQQSATTTAAIAASPSSSGLKNFVTSLLFGHDLAALRKHSDAIEAYLAAFCYAPTQPLTALCIASYLIMLSNHKLTKQRHETLLKGLIFLHRYIAVRRTTISGTTMKYAETASDSNSSSSSINANGESTATVEKNDVGSNILYITAELGLYQETLYNLGKAFHEIHMYHLAADQYNAALLLADRHPALIEQKEFVTKEAAHNLVLIYKRSGAVDLAFQIMQKYLCF